jgi:hypothetical protein
MSGLQVVGQSPFRKRITVLVGHFGSGKTEIALNFALNTAVNSSRVTLVDLDVVKPYFRSRAARAILQQAGIELLAPEGEYHHADLPILIPAIRDAFRDETRRVILDVGGDGTGARALGAISDVVPEEDSERILVLNFRRPFTQNVDEAVEMVRTIEAVSQMSITGLVSNTHLMAETTRSIIQEGYDQAAQTAERLDLPLLAVAVDEAAAADLDGTVFDCPIMVLRRIVRPPFEQSRKAKQSGPLFTLN